MSHCSRLCHPQFRHSRIYPVNHHSSISRLYRLPPQKSSAGPTTSPHHFHLLSPLPLPATLASFVLRGSTPSELCANVIAVPVASLENPEIETNFPSPTLSAILSLGVFPTIHTLYPPFLLLIIQEIPISLLLFTLPLLAFLLHLILIGTVTLVCSNSVLH